ncbi:hypothetical protein ABBQ32_010116 [Trebouxia sp. C0010 RCD-2024]
MQILKCNRAAISSPRVLRSWTGPPTAAPRPLSVGAGPSFTSRPSRLPQWPWALLSRPRAARDSRRAFSPKARATEVAFIHSKISSLLFTALPILPGAVLYQNAAQPSATAGSSPDSLLVTTKTIALEGRLARDKCHADETGKEAAAAVEAVPGHEAESAHARAVADAALSSADNKAVPNCPIRLGRGLKHKITRSRSAKVRFSLGPDDAADGINTDNGAGPDSLHLDATARAGTGSLTSQSGGSSFGADNAGIAVG